MNTRPSHRLNLISLALAALAAVSLACSALSFGADSTDPTSPPGPTAAIEEQAADTGASTPTAAEAQASSLGAAQGECANGLLPLEVGNQWTYQQRPATATPEAEAANTPGADFTFTWTVTEVDESQASIRMQSPSLGISATYTVNCEAGAILTFPTMAMNLSLPGGGSGSADINYTHSGGQFLPSLETFEDNNWDYQWETEIRLSGSVISSPVEGQTFEMQFQESPWTMSWSTAGAGDAAFERLVVPAGTFEEALKLRQEASMTMNMTMEGMDLSTSFNSTAHQWYARGVGLLRTESLGTELNMSGMDLPIPMEDMQSGIELVSFRQVKD